MAGVSKSQLEFAIRNKVLVDHAKMEKVPILDAETFLQMWNAMHSCDQPMKW
jgi:hypothetical protein